MNLKYLNIHKAQGFTLVEIMISVLVSGFLIMGAIQFAKKMSNQLSSGQASSTNQQELSRFQSLLLTDLARAGNDASGASILESYHLIFGNDTCEKNYFEFGIVPHPSASDCKSTYGILGILSYQGFDNDHNGVFFPEETIDFISPRLRPFANGQTNQYNDFIVYDLDTDNRTVVRKNIGDPSTNEGDFSEVVLRNVASFDVEFTKQYDPNDISKPGQNQNRYSGVVVTVKVTDGNPDPNYNNPEFTQDSAFYHYRTSTRKIVYSIIDSALCVY